MKKSLGIALVLLALCLSAALAADRVYCRFVIDGDTIYADGVGKIRLLGVDTPELGRNGKPDQPGAQAAREYMQGLLQGKFVFLEYDAERRDRYGRTLAYVKTAEGLDVNEELLRLGLAKPIRYLPYARKSRYLTLYGQGGKQ